jgi:hypothetical protein
VSAFPAETLVLWNDWFRRTRESQTLHYRCANHFSRLHLLLGIPTIVLSAVVGTAVFASLEREASGDLRIAVGMLSVLAAVLGGLQTFLGYAERSNRHRATGAGYSAMRRRLELLKTFSAADQAAIASALGDIAKRLDELAESAPEVPKWLRTRSDAALKDKGYGPLYTAPLQEQARAQGP